MKELSPVTPFKGPNDEGGATSGHADEFNQRQIELMKRDEEIRAVLSSQAQQTAQLKHGQNIVEADQSSVADVMIEGSTMVNLLNRTRKSEDFVKDESASTATWELQSNDFIKVSNATKFRGIMPKTKPQVLEKESKFIYIYEHYGIAVQTSVPNSSTVGLSDSVKPQLFTSIFSGDGLERTVNTLQIERLSEVSGDFFIRHPRLYKITDSEYTEAITLSKDQLAKKYPYVDGVQHVQNPVITKKGKNLLPPLSEWDFIHHNAKLNKPYELEINSPETTNSYIEIPALPNTRYRARLIQSSESNMHIQERTQPGGVVLRTVVVVSSPIGTTWFTTNEQTRTLRINLQNNKGVNYLKVSDVMLHLQEEGATEPFQPQNEDYIYTQAKLGSTLDGSVKDVIYKKDDNYVFRESLKKDFLIDGSFNMQLIENFEGGKRFKPVNLSSFEGAKQSSYNLFGYDIKRGTLIQGGYSNNRSAVYSHNDSSLSVILMNDVTGFNDNQNSISISEVTGYFRNNPILLTYDLAVPKEYPLNFEGSIGLQSGQNLLEVDSGVIVREKATAQRYNTTDGQAHYGINNINVNINTPLNHKVEKIIGLYEDGKEINHYRVFASENAHGKVFIRIAENDYNPDADYTVTYTVMDKHQFTTNVDKASVIYQTSFKSSHDKSVQQIVANASDISRINLLMGEIVKSLRILGGE